MFVHNEFIKHEGFHGDCLIITECVNCCQSDIINASGDGKATILTPLLLCSVIVYEIGLINIGISTTNYPCQSTYILIDTRGPCKHVGFRGPFFLQIRPWLQLTAEYVSIVSIEMYIKWFYINASKHDWYIGLLGTLYVKFGTDNIGIIAKFEWL